MPQRHTLWPYIFIVLFLTACSKAGHKNSLLALTEFPGYLEGADLEQVEILKEETVPSGVVLLYRYPAFGPDSSGAILPDGHCVAVTLSLIHIFKIGLI